MTSLWASSFDVLSSFVSVGYRTAYVDPPMRTTCQRVKVLMAPHPGIDTDEIRDRARKDLLDLLEGVCKNSCCALQLGRTGLKLISRFEARRIWSLRKLWPDLLVYLSSFLRFKNMESTEFSCWRTTTLTPRKGTWCSWLGGKRQAMRSQ